MPSSVIRFFRYDPRASHLLVVFQTGRRYVYKDVPDRTAREFERAFSKGDYFNRHIRDRYPFERLN